MIRKLWLSGLAFRFRACCEKSEASEALLRWWFPHIRAWQGEEGPAGTARIDLQRLTGDVVVIRPVELEPSSRRHHSGQIHEELVQAYKQQLCGSL